MASLVRDKRGTWYIVTSVKGKRVWRSTRTKNKREAFKIFTTPPPESKPASPASKLLSECMADFMPYAKINHSRSTADIYFRLLAKLVKLNGDPPIDSISSRDIEQYKILRSQEVKPASVNIDIRALRAFFNVMKKWKVVESNPCEGVRELRIPEQTPLFFDEGQLERLVEGIQEKWLRDIVIFTAMTGVRRGEVVNLQWSDVNLGNRTVIIRSTSGYQVKRGKMRTIPLNDTCMALLSKMEHREGYAFRGERGRKANGNFVGEQFRMTIRRLGFDGGLHFHSLRHTFASLLVKKGVSLYQVQKLLGHSSSQMTEVYAHLQSSEMQGVVGVLSIGGITAMAI